MKDVDRAGLVVGVIAVSVALAGATATRPLSTTDELRAVARAHGVTALPPPPARPPALVALGEALYFDPILSGGRDIACATCHHVDHGTGDDRVLSVGTGAVVKDGRRMPGPEHDFVARNAPPVLDLAQPDVDVVFWDGRLQRRRSDGSFVLFEVAIAQTGNLRHVFRGFDDAVSAQAMLPVLARQEMRGRAGEVDIDGAPNDVANLSDDDFDGVWRTLTARVTQTPGYRKLLTAAFPGRRLDTLRFDELARALGAFQGTRFSTHDTAWDRFLRGDDAALEDEQRRGAAVFFGAARCVVCHSGPRFTDQRFHDIGVRPIGRGPSNLGFADLGATLRSHAGAEARFAFRTPTLRHVTRTGPWMHDGAYTTLTAAVRHHLDAATALRDYDASALPPEMRRHVHRGAGVLDDVAANLDPLLREPVRLADDDVNALLAFLGALESPGVAARAGSEPATVPSGLPLARP